MQGYWVNSPTSFELMPEKSPFGTVFLLLGPEIGEKAAFIEVLKKNVESTTGDKPEELKFYPFDTAMSEIVSILKNRSLFSSHRFVQINDAHTLKKPEVDLLAEFLRQPAEDVTVLASEVLQNQIDRKITSAVPRQNIKIFWELFEEKKHLWINSFFKTRSKKITEEARDLLLEMVENNTHNLEQVCSQIADFFTGKEEILSSDIEQFLYHSKEENVFTLFDRIAMHDLQGSVLVLRNILMSGSADPVQFLQASPGSSGSFLTF